VDAERPMGGAVKAQRRLGGGFVGRRRADDERQGLDLGRLGG